jgi:hypothetical protein
MVLENVRFHKKVGREERDECKEIKGKHIFPAMFTPLLPFSYVFFKFV